MQNVGQTEEVLMVVKTYPTPSRTYGELVCTAGIRLRDMKWIRIYPYPFRLLGQDNRFAKWSVMSMPLAKATDDPRPDSYNLIDSNQIKLVRSYPTGDVYWSERMKFIRSTALPSVSELKRQMMNEEKTAWGASILPVPVQAGSAQVSFKRLGDQWNPKELAKLQRAKDQLDQNLFVPDEIKQFFTTLRRVPYRVYLSYEDMTGERFKHCVLDWEIAMLWFNTRERASSDEEALEK